MIKWTRPSSPASFSLGFYILQAIKNLTVGSSGNKANTAYKQHDSYTVTCMLCVLLCHSAWEDQRRRCANICHMALPARASQCQYENSGTPASLISHALNEILALGIPRYTYGQLVATAFFCIVGKEIQSKYREKNKTLN